MKPQLCIYCNCAIADTVDHIPPKLLLAKPYPDNLLTVPSCLKCSASFQKHDEYTRVIASVNVRNAEHQTVKVNMPAILRSIQKPEAQSFSRYLASRTTPRTVLGTAANRWGRSSKLIRGALMQLVEGSFEGYTS